MNSFALRPIGACPDDLADIKALLSSCALPHEDLTPAHLATFLIVRQGSALVAVAGLERFGECALLRSLAVAPAQRHQDIASRLVATLEAGAYARGLRHFYLLTETAKDFFLKRGYEVVPRAAAPRPLQESAEFRTLCPAAAVCMHKPLA